MLYRLQRVVDAREIEVDRWTVFQLGVEGDDRWHHVPGCPWYSTEQAAAAAVLDFRKGELIRVTPW